MRLPQPPWTLLLLLPCIFEKPSIPLHHTFSKWLQPHFSLTPSPSSALLPPTSPNHVAPSTAPPSSMFLLIPWFQTTPSRLSFLPISSNPSPPSVNTNRIGSFQNEDLENYGAAGLKDTPDEQDRDAPVKEQDRISEEIFQNLEYETSGSDNSFLVKLAIAVGVAVTATIISAGFKQPFGSSFGFQSLAEGSSSSVLSATPDGFTFKAFGYRIVLPEYTPGWVYFWLLMAAGCGLFISEEALNIWVGISLARMLHLDGSWQSFAESFSRKAPHIISTIFWVYWGVCISDMIPFYLGKAFRQTGASDDVCAKLGIGKEKAASITRVVQRYGNFIGFVERVSLGVRNPTAFLAGAMGISPECFFAGVCFGGLVTLPLQLGIGFLLRERPVFALATVATAVGVWTVFPYAVAASTALFLFLRRRYFT